MQEPVYVLHLITCHGHIMPRLAELLFLFLNCPYLQHQFCQFQCQVSRVALFLVS